MFVNRLKSVLFVSVGLLAVCLAGLIGAGIDDSSDGKVSDKGSLMPVAPPAKWGPGEGAWDYMAAMSNILAEAPDPRMRALALILSGSMIVDLADVIDRESLLADLAGSDDPAVLAAVLHHCQRLKAETIPDCDSSEILDRLAEVDPDNIWVSLQRFGRDEHQEQIGRAALGRQLQGRPHHRTHEAELLAGIVRLRDYEKHLPEDVLLDSESARRAMDEVLFEDMPFETLSPTLRQAIEQSLVSDPMQMAGRSLTQSTMFMQVIHSHRFGMIESICRDPADRDLCSRIIELMFADDHWIITPMVASGLALNYLDEDDPLRRRAETIRNRYDEWKKAGMQAEPGYAVCEGMLGLFKIEQQLLDTIQAGEMAAQTAFRERLPHYCG